MQTANLSSKLIRRELRRNITHQVLHRRGLLSEYLRLRSTPGALRSYAKKIAIAEVSRMRREGTVR